MADLVFENSAERKSRTTGVLWGLPKTGKTTFLCSLPGKILFIMFDPDGDQSIEDNPNITIVRMYEQDDATIVRYMRKSMPSLIRKGEYDSVVTDSLSTLNAICLNVAIDEEIGKSGGSKGFIPTLEAPGQSAYGARTALLVDIVNKLLRSTGSVGAHCWFTAHQDTPTTDPQGNMLYITLTLSGKAISNVGLNVSEIWYLSMISTGNKATWKLAIAPCRSKEPMGSRIFDVTGSPEFELRYDKSLGSEQPHSIAMWFNKWVEGGRKDLPLPK